MAESKYESSMLSQDLIDNLLDNAMNEEDDSSAAQDNSDSGLITEDEINMLLEGASSGDVDITDVDSLTDLDDSDDDSGLVSQNEINNLLNGNGADKDDDLVSQNDIEALLNEDSGGGDLSQDDLDNLLNGGGDSGDSQDQAGIDALLNAGENDDAEENELISQNDIDNLLGGAPAGNADDVEEDEGIAAPSDEIGELLDNAEEEEEGSLISQDDIDKLLSTDDDDDDGDDGAEEESDLISQDDINSLLTTEDEEPADTEESLISQDDINKLMNLDDDFDLDDENDPMDSIEPDMSDPVDEESVDELLGTDSDTVILEEPEKKKKGWLVKAAVVATILLVIGGGTFSYFKFFGDKEPEVVDVSKNKVENVVEVPDPKDFKPVEKPEIDEIEKKKEVVDPVNPEEIVFTKMSNFIVLSPNSKKMTFISGDISLELMTASLNKIKENEAFYRNIIYRAIKASIAQNGDTKIVKEDLADKLKKELNDQNLSIENVVFTDFEQG